MTGNQNALAPRVFEREGVVYASSQDVADCFEKQHKHVLDASRNLLKGLTGRNLGWFKETTYADAKGEARPAWT
jgi:phage regulator Rha-like protein